MNAAWRRHIDNAGRRAAIALGFAIPVSVALDNLLLLAVLLCWLCGGSYAEKWRLLAGNPVARCALLLFGLLVAAALWGEAPSRETADALLKYLDLAFVPLFMHFFRDEAARRQGLLAFAGALVLILALSFMIKAGVVPEGPPLRGTQASPVVFKFRITHGYLMAFGAFLFCCLALAAPPGSRARIAWVLLAVLAAINVLLMVEGITGHITLGLLALLLVASHLPRRWMLPALAAATLLAAGLLALPGPLSQRAATLAQELQSWQPGVAAAPHSSSGLRLEFYRNTLDIIAGHPLAGVGTGGFPRAYAERVRGSGMLETENPHNEYLLVAAQAGLAALAALLLLFAAQWRSAAGLAQGLDRSLARGLVLAMAAGCLFNSFLLDHAEGLFFAWLGGLLFAGLTPRPPGAAAR